MIHFEARHIKIHWDDEIKAVWAEWLAYAEGNEFRRGLDAGLDLLEKKAAKHWLADTRGLGPVTQEDQMWLNNDWFPHAIKAGTRWMAIVVPHRMVAHLSVKRVMSRVDEEDLITSYFDSFNDARAWLHNQR